MPAQVPLSTSYINIISFFERESSQFFESGSSGLANVYKQEVDAAVYQCIIFQDMEFFFLDT